jgi:hypothetical protein
MLEGWDLQFTTDQNVFFKSEETCGKLYYMLFFNGTELDEYYGDIYSLIIGKKKGNLVLISQTEKSRSFTILESRS